MSTGLFILPSLRVGGAENVAVALAKWLEPRADVHFVTFEGGENPYGVEHSVLSSAPMWSVAGRKVPRLFWDACVELERLKSELRPDFSLSFTELPNVANAITGAELRVLSLHSAISKNLSKATQPLMIPLLHATHSSPIYAVSEGVKEDYERFLGVRSDVVSVIPNPVDFGQLKILSSLAMPNEFQFLSGLRYLVCVGRLVEPKNHSHLLDLMVTIRHWGLKLVLVGDGPLRGVLESECDALGLSYWRGGAYANEEIVFLGHLENPFPIVKRARVFLFPSLWEGFGLALLEALALGVPAVSHDCEHGPREIFGYQTSSSFPDPSIRFPNGSLIRGFSIDAWTEEIGFWSERAPTSDSLLERYSIDSIGRRWLQALGVS